MVEYFYWDQRFVLNLDEVDKQHHHLVDLINLFGEQVAKNTINPDVINKITNELVDYTKYHFSEEEKLMTDFSLDQRHITRHVDNHRKFVEFVLSMHKEIESNHNGNKSRELLDYLINWLAFHILVEDKNMADQIHAIEQGVSPEQAYEDGEKKADDATGPLVQALLGLFRQLSSRNRELVEFNRTLEDKIAERTRELVEANRQFEELSLTDALTGLPNRRHALETLANHWQESIHDNTPLTCMMIDADHFKEVNDNYGHDAGDEVLKMLGKTLKYAVRSDDFVARLGGDEFFIICPATNKDGGYILAEQILKQVAELHIPTGSGAWHGSVSIGIAQRTDEIKGYEALIKLADESVYLAKKAGRGCIRSKNL